MSKYDIALDIINDSLHEPDNSVIFKHAGLNELKKALEHAQQQEKLLNKIKEIIDREEGLPFSSMLEESISYHEIKKLIKELENDK